MKKQRIAMLEMLLCACLWSIVGIFIKLIPWNPLVIAGFRKEKFSGLDIITVLITLGGGAAAEPRLGRYLRP